MNLYLFRKYWSKHKRRLFSLILSIILLTATAVFSILNQRTELRRRLHAMYDENGNYSVALPNVSDEQYNEISQFPYIEKIGKISACGRTEIAGEKYTIGSFDNEEAEYLYHTPMVKGELPRKKGQIAAPEFILDQLYGSVEVGDTVYLEYRTPEGEAVSGEYELSGIIRNYINRFDMEYTCNFDNITVTRNEIDHPTPSIYIHRDDNTAPCYNNYLIGVDDKLYFTDEKNDVDEMIEKLWDITGSVISGKQYFAQITMSGILHPSGGHLETQKDEGMKIIGIITVLMMIVSGIAMFSGVISIMPQRVESLRLLRSIGASKRRLIFMFVTEFLLFFVIGVSLGIISACGLHELLIHLQKMLGIAAYRGYTAEYIIELQTNSPFVFPISLSFVIALISLIVPLKNIITMTFYKRANVRRSRQKVNSINSAYSKITGNRLLSVLSALSIVIVICSTVFGYCYYTQTDKGTSYFSPGNANTEAAYYIVKGVDLRANEIDCAVTANIPRCSGVAVYDKEFGISAAEEKRLSEAADVLAYGSYHADTIIYDSEHKAPPQFSNSAALWNENWEFYDEFSSRTMYMIPLLLVNDNMMKMICDGDASDVVLVSKNANFAYEIGDTIPMSTCLCDETIHVWLDTFKNIEAVVTKRINLQESDLEQNELLKSTGLFNFPDSCGIAMTAKKAEELGFYYPNYSAALLRFDEELSDDEIREKVSSATDKPFITVTLEELEHKAKMNKLSSNANSMILFVLLFVLCFISIWNLLAMNAQNSIDKFAVMHSIGMPVKRIKRLFISGMMKTAAISVILGAVISFAGQSIVSEKYDRYAQLLGEQQQLMGNEYFPDSWFSMPLEAIDENDELYPVTKEMEELRSAFMLEKEMWLPRLTVPLLLIGLIIILSAFICAAVTARRIRIERSLNDDKGR